MPGQGREASPLGVASQGPRSEEIRNTGRKSQVENEAET
jgi:hypothetical protein